MKAQEGKGEPIGLSQGDISLCLLPTPWPNHATPRVKGYRNIPHLPIHQEALAGLGIQKAAFRIVTYKIIYKAYS